MIVIGLTGGIGSGKSSATQHFAALGVPIIDADIIARELTEAESPTLHEISKNFGNSILKDDGSLNRKHLRELIFSDQSKRLWLEKLLHPRINQEIKNRLGQIKAPYCIVVIPLLVETGPYHFIDRILLIDATESARIDRLKTRDQSSPEQIQKIMNTQADRQTRLAAADDIILNDGKLEHLTEQVEKLHQQYLKMGQ